MDATPAPPGTAPPHAAALVAADRWRLWSTLVRGLSHQLANASQMLTLSPPPAAALEEARERIAHATAALGVLRRGHSSSPTLLPAVLDDVEQLQRLQMDFPATSLEATLAEGLPALALRHDEAAHLLLALVTAFKEAAGERRATLTLEAAEEGLGARLMLRDPETCPAPEPAPALAALLTAAAGTMRAHDDGALSVWLPAWRRPAARA